MSTQVNTPGMALKATAAIGSRTLVKYDGTLCGADAVQDWIGVAQQPAAIGEQIPLRFFSSGTAIMMAAEAITSGALVYKAASGQVGLTNTNALIGRALEAASGAGVTIQIKPLVA